MSRQRVLGLPIGKQRRSRSQVAKAVGAGAAMLAAPAVAVPAVRKASKVVHGAGKVVGKGQEMAGKASDVMDTATDIKEAVSSHSSTIGKIGGVISAVKGKSGNSKPKLSHLIEQHTDIAVARSTVYNQWTQLEMFPTITKGIESVQQEDDEKSKWTSKIGPSRRTWTGHVVEQIPDERIAWKSEGGASLQGVVTFHSLDVDLTRVLVQMEYKPKGPVEWVGNTLRIQRRRAARDLRLFKHYLELRNEETGAWRGRIDEDKKLEPQFAGQGRVKGAKKSGDGGSGSDTNRGRASSDDRKDASRRRSSSEGPGSSRDRGSDGGSNGGGANGRSSTGSRGSSGSDGRSSNGRSRAASGDQSSARRSTPGNSSDQRSSRPRRTPTRSSS
ncbi:MAG: SRPBCC family protein [Actinomycetota bacterium]|nr:SRPBCC family protein [Actinomycetota bacterium]